ncbi:TPA: host cell division inhibitor Icd-like protein [Serratia fonticola]|nr:host cell division inhibitor Icd-like protein [Serratia fonticola]
MCFIVLPLRSNAFFSFSSCIGSYQYYNGNRNGNYHFVVNQYHSVKTAKPGSGGTLTGPLTTTDSLNIEVAMSDHITPLTGRNSLTPNKFTWRFLAVSRSNRNAKPCRMSVEAHTEREARQELAPHFILSFAARVPLEGEFLGKQEALPTPKLELPELTMQWWYENNFPMRRDNLPRFPGHKPWNDLTLSPAMMYGADTKSPALFLIETLEKMGFDLTGPRTEVETMQAMLKSEKCAVRVCGDGKAAQGIEEITTPSTIAKTSTVQEVSYA